MTPAEAAALVDALDVYLDRRQEVRVGWRKGMTRAHNDFRQDNYTSARARLVSLLQLCPGSGDCAPADAPSGQQGSIPAGAPAYNHTRGDSAATPCPACAASLAALCGATHVACDPCKLPAGHGGVWHDDGQRCWRRESTWSTSEGEPTRTPAVCSHPSQDEDGRCHTCGAEEIPF